MSHHLWVNLNRTRPCAEPPSVNDVMQCGLEPVRGTAFDVKRTYSQYWFCWAMMTLSAAVLLAANPQGGLGRSVVFCSVAGGSLNGLGAWTSFCALDSGGNASIGISPLSLSTSCCDSGRAVAGGSAHRYTIRRRRGSHRRGDSSVP